MNPGLHFGVHIGAGDTARCMFDHRGAFGLGGNRELLRTEVRAPGKQGFTLIELMVVMVLIGVLSAMIIPEMKGTYGDALLRSSARDLVNVCHIAYSRAVSLNQVQVIRFQSAVGRYEIQRQVRNRSRPELVPLKDVSGSRGELDNRISLEVHKTAETEPQGGGTESVSGGGTENASPSSNPTTDQDAHQAQDLVGFYPDGTADPAELWLRDRAGFGLRLRIDPITARVEILELAKQ